MQCHLSSHLCEDLWHLIRIRKFVRSAYSLLLLLLLKPTTVRFQWQSTSSFVKSGHVVRSSEPIYTETHTGCDYIYLLVPLSTHEYLHIQMAVTMTASFTHSTPYLPVSFAFTC